MTKKNTLSTIVILFLTLQGATCRAQTPDGGFWLTGDERPVCGNSLCVRTGGDLSHYTFRWTRGDALGTFDDGKPLSAEPACIITEDDYEHWLRVTVCNIAGDTVFTHNTWISKLPVLYIDTEDGRPITSKTDYMSAKLRIQGNADYVLQYDGKTEIRGRGTTSWAQYPQKPYKLKLDEKTSLFGFGKSKHWVLISNFNDKSCLRNYIASELAERLGALGMKMTWVDVVLNGEAKGCYMLSQHIRPEKNSVDIFDWNGEAKDVADALFDAVRDADALEETDRDLFEETMQSNLSWVTSGTVTLKGKTYDLSDYGLKREYDIRQGYLFEATGNGDGITQFTTPGKVHFEVSKPEHLSTNIEMFSYVTGFWNDFEAEYSRVPTVESPKDFSKYADMKSMVAVWLVNELLGQGDPTNSRYSYIARDGKLYFGPVWDFDCAADCWIVDPTVNYFLTLIYSHAYMYYKKWFPDAELCQMAYEAYWNVARPFVMDFISEGGKMDATYEFLAQAGRVNDMLWGSYPSQLRPSAKPRTTAEDVEHLRSFLSKHINYLDKHFVSVEKLIETMNTICPYPCGQDVIDGIQTLPDSPQKEESTAEARIIIKDRHLYIVRRGGETYSIDGKNEKVKN